MIIRDLFETGFELSVALIRGGLLLFAVFSDYIEQLVLLFLPIRVKDYRIDSRDRILWRAADNSRPADHRKALYFDSPKGITPGMRCLHPVESDLTHEYRYQEDTTPLDKVVGQCLWQAICNVMKTIDFNLYREKYLEKIPMKRRIRVLLIAESPPTQDEDIPAFFYYDEDDLRRVDRGSLFGEVMTGLYPIEWKRYQWTRNSVGNNKRIMLTRFSNDGLYLIDATDEPPQGLRSARKTGRFPFFS